MKNLLAIRDLGRGDIDQILALSADPLPDRPLTGRGVALYFEKPSARTRNSMEMATVQLGGHPIYLQRDELGMGDRESVEDIARTLACYHAVVAARVRNHGVLEAMASAADVPVLNMLSNSDHPLQALADMMTIRQLLGRIEGARIAFIGEANNVARSLAEACFLLGAELTLACPEGYGFETDLPGVRHVTDPLEAIEGANIVYADVWVSMGDEAETEARRKAFAGQRVDGALMERANDAWFLHCLPARRGEEVAAEVIDGPRSAVWQQATNRMHTARGVLRWMIGAA